MFKIKDPSLLQFDQHRLNPQATKNLETIFGINKIASDSMMRKFFDPIAPDTFRPIFADTIKQLDKEKILRKFLYLGSSLLIAMDGTTFFTSRSNFSPICRTAKRAIPKGNKESNRKSALKKSKKKTEDNPDYDTMTNRIEAIDEQADVEFSLQMLTPAIVKPGLKTVLPLMPEPIVGSDGKSKQDSETNAVKRILVGLRDYLPSDLNATILLDSLFSKSPMIHEITGYGFHYIANAKPGDHVHLFRLIEIMKEHGRIKTMTVKDEKITKTYEWACSVPLFKMDDTPIVNFLKCTIHDGKKTTTFTWVTSHELNEQSVVAVEKAGRSRWKIENEVFNTLKNHGYQFEHNFGLGDEFLAINFAIIMMIAFLSDQITEAISGKFQELREKTKNRQKLWGIIRFAFNWDEFNNYEEILNQACQKFVLTPPKRSTSKSNT